MGCKESNQTKQISCMSISTESAVRDKETKLKLKTEKVAKESKTDEKVRPIPTVTELKKQQSEGDSR